MIIPNDQPILCNRTKEETSVAILAQGPGCKQHLKTDANRRCCNQTLGPGAHPPHKRGRALCALVAWSHWILVTSLALTGFILCFIAGLALAVWQRLNPLL